MMEVIYLDRYHVDTYTMYKVAERMKKGAIAILPTDSVYALACVLSNKEGVDRILRITGKKEKASKLSLICASLKEVSQFTLPFSNHVFKTMNRYLPGPYTFILKADRSVRKIFDNSKSEIGIRIIDSPAMDELLKNLGEALITTSLSRLTPSDEAEVYYEDGEEIKEVFKHTVDLFLETDEPQSIPSTVLMCTGDEIVLERQGKGELE